MVKSNKNPSPIPATFKTAELAGEYWDTHDLAEYKDLTQEVEFKIDINRRVFLAALEPKLAKRLTEVAHKQGISTETLINVWLTEKIEEMA